MFLFIFESVGTSELILIGAVALMIFGPRKLPQMAKTLGKAMADFKNTTNEFKSTWEKEVSFEESSTIPNHSIAKQNETAIIAETKPIQSNPEIKDVDPNKFNFSNENTANLDSSNDENKINLENIHSSHKIEDKQNWL